LASLGNGIKDNVQVYNIPKFDGYHQRQQPAILADNIAEIEAFSRVMGPVQIWYMAKANISSLEMPHGGSRKTTPSIRHSPRAG